MMSLWCKDANVDLADTLVVTDSAMGRKLEGELISSAEFFSWGYPWENDDIL